MATRVSTPMTASTPLKVKLNAIGKKVYYADNMRTALTALVILHHASMNFGGVGLTSYYGHKPMSSIPLVGFNVLNQSYAMGAFMYLGGYFTKQGAKSKTAAQFVQDRLYRLGLPAVAYTLVCAPLTLALHAARNGQQIGLKWWIDYVKALRGLKGVVWFLGLLLCFDLSFIAKKTAFKALNIRTRPSGARKSTQVSGLSIAAVIAATSAGDFLARLIWPVGAIVNPLGFQPAFFSHYLANYVLGTYVNDVADVIPSNRATIGLGAGSVISAYIFAKTLIKNKSVQPMLGGFNTSAATYAVANNAIGFLLGTSLIRALKKYGNRPWGKLNAATYTAFLLHMPILTAITVATAKIEAGSLLKTAGVGSATIASTWTAAAAFDRVWAEIEKMIVKSAKLSK